MTKSEARPAIVAVNELFSTSPDGLREIVRAVVQEMLEAEMTDALGAEKSARTGRPARLPLRLLHPHARHPGRQARVARAAGSRRPVLDRAFRALSTLRAGVGGDAGRDVRAGRFDPQGQGDHRGVLRPCRSRPPPSPPSTSAWTKASTPSPRRPLAEPFPYLILDARYEKVREGGVVASQAVLIAVGIDWDGRRQILAVDMANRESSSSWKDFLLGLRRRGLDGVEFVVADDHAGLRAAIREVLPEAAAPAMLRALPPQRPRPSPAQGRRRLPAGVALAVRPAKRRRGPPRPRRLDRQMGRPLPEACRLGRGNDRGHLHLLSSAAPAS